MTDRELGEHLATIMSYLDWSQRPQDVHDYSIGCEKIGASVRALMDELKRPPPRPNTGAR